MKSMSLQSLAHAKINLYLHITGRRSDGYHELDSLAVFAPAADRLVLEERDDSDGAAFLTIEGPFGAGLAADDSNLVLRAASALRECSASPDHLPAITMTLDKHLPVASGIGGGSADAAAALRLVARAWGLEKVDLQTLAAKLGADVPVCLDQVPRRMKGVGDMLSDAPAIPDCAILLVNPGIAVPTPSIFKHWKEACHRFSLAPELPVSWSDFPDMLRTLKQTENDLQASAIALYPVIGNVIDAIAVQPGCGLARMSGSGATCFGLFGNDVDAQAAAKVLSKRGWWCDAGMLHGASVGY